MANPCPQCDKEFDTEFGLKCHYGQIHEGSLKNTKACERCGEEFAVWPSQEDRTRQCSPCRQEFGPLEITCKNISKGLEGRELSSESRKKISESLSGENSIWYGVRGEDHPAYGFEPNEEQRKEMSETHKGHKPYGGTNWHEVEETGHKVRSSWEKKIDLILHNSNVDYEYEPHQLSLSDGRGYLPDFVVDNRVIIEVKGWADEVSKEKARMVAEEFPEYDFVVVGADVGSGIHIPWEERESVLKHLNRGEE